MTMRERIATGKLFTDMCEGLPEERMRGKELAYDFNHTRPRDVKRRMELIQEIFGSVGENVWIEPPLNIAYGSNITFGNNCYVNSNLTMVDDYKITIGNGVIIAPNVVAVGSPCKVLREITDRDKKYYYKDKKIEAQVKTPR